MCLLLQLAMGKMMDQGPVLIITFQAQLVMVIRNTKGDVIEGDPVSKRTTQKHTTLRKHSLIHWNVIKVKFNL